MARKPVDIKPVISRDAMKFRYETMLKNVANMIAKDGPVYSTWIYFQLGANDSDYIIFDTSSQDKKQNLIADLHVEKSCSGVTNSFTLNIFYDPFNFGQNSSDEIEILDEFVANAMDENFSSTNACKGKIQYGYNSTYAKSDDALVSPLYTFYITEATSNVRFDSGIASYTFTGVSVIASECDYVTSFDKIDNEQLLNAVGRILYTYYGDPDNPPDNIEGIESVVPQGGTTRYAIDINNSDLRECQYITEDKTSVTQSPWLYCESLLNKYNLTIDEVNSGQYNDNSNTSINKMPRYSMYVTDTGDTPTIHVVHISPEEINDNNISIDYIFSWGLKDEYTVETTSKNIIVGWNPSVDLRTYLIKKSNYNRYKNLEELYRKYPDTYRDAYEKFVKNYTYDISEMYNAELELVGIPADPPMSAEIVVIPRILESVSRTKGTYAITGAVDEISNTGVFKSILKLFRKSDKSFTVTHIV